MVKTFEEAYELLKPYPSDFFMSIMLAQWALESDYGRSELALMANNFSGHKTTGWTGEVYRKDTIEDDGTGKKFVAKSEPFRKYASAEEWAKHHASWMQRKLDTYAKAINAKTVEEQAQALQGTYATDTAYAKKLMDMIKANNLTRFDKKESAKMAYIGLDIGHGSDTWSSGGGKGVYTGGKTYEEHNFNSIVGKKLKVMLEKSGHKVTFGVQQPNSPDTSLRARTNYFNAQKVDIMVSIHANWIGSFWNSTNGIGAFYASYSSGPRTNNSKELADLIITEYRKQGQAIYGAGSIASVLTNWTNFHMTREVSMTAVLMELGFMSGNKDFDKVFGSQQDKYTTQMAQGMCDAINNYFGNTKPLPSTDFDLPAYQQPTQAFKPLKVGDKVTIRDGQTYWYIPDGKGRKPSKDFAGDTDTITKVMDVEVGYSKRAYLLKDKVSWVLEQDLVEGRSGWSSEQKDQQEYLDYVYIDGVKRAIGDVIE